MGFLNIAKSRYTTKVYDCNRKIEDATIEKLKEIVWLSPSSINSQPWRFTFVSNDEIKKRLAEVSFSNSQRVIDASHIVVFSMVSDVKNFEESKLSHLSEGAAEYYNLVLKPMGDDQITTWLRSQVYLSLGFFLSGAASLGIDSTPMEGIDTKAYDVILQDDGYTTLFAVAIGYRSKEDTNQPSLTPKFRLNREEVIRSL